MAFWLKVGYILLKTINNFNYTCLTINENSLLGKHFEGSGWHFVKSVLLLKRLINVAEKSLQKRPGQVTA